MDSTLSITIKTTFRLVQGLQISLSAQSLIKGRNMIFFKLGLLISSILFQQSLFAASSVISIHLRSFAPFESFGGGFEGDNRGFSTDPKVKSRIHTTLKYDYLQNRTLNITSYSSGTVYLPTGTTATAKPT